MNAQYRLKRSIRCWVIAFIFCLALSGATASVPETGLAWILQYDPFPGTGLRHWLDLSYQAILLVNTRYPFLSYGYDWLAFGHLAIAILFLGGLIRCGISGCSNPAASSAYW